MRCHRCAEETKSGMSRELLSFLGCVTIQGVDPSECTFKGGGGYVPWAPCSLQYHRMLLFFFFK